MSLEKYRSLMNQYSELYGKKLLLTVDGLKQAAAIVDWASIVDGFNDDDDFMSELYNQMFDYQILEEFEEPVNDELLLPFAVLGLTGTEEFAEVPFDTMCTLYLAFSAEGQVRVVMQTGAFGVHVLEESFQTVMQSKVEDPSDAEIGDDDDLWEAMDKKYGQADEAGLDDYVRKLARAAAAA